MKTLLISLLLVTLAACGGNSGSATGEPKPAVFSDGLGIPPPPRLGGTPAICVASNADGSQSTYHCVQG